MRLWVALPAALAVLAGAAPVHATLLVRSDGGGLLIQDKNGLSDGVVLYVQDLQRRPGYHISSIAFGDVFRFDIQTGCRISSESPAARIAPASNPRSTWRSSPATTSST